MLKRAVTVKMLDMTWFHANKENFNSFAGALQGLPSTMYSSDFVSYLLDAFWHHSQKNILKRYCIPYYCFVVACVLHMHDSLSRKEIGFEPGTPTNDKIYNKSTGAVTLILVAYILRSEILQFRGTRCVAYFNSLMNYVDIISITLTLAVTLITMLEVQTVPIETVRMMAAITTFLMLLKIYDWLALFELTAFFVLLVN